MYRRPRTLLWTGSGIFAALAATDAALGLTREATGVYVGITGAGLCIICACIARNRVLSEDVQGELDELRGQVKTLGEDLGKSVAEVRDLAEAWYASDEQRREEERKRAEGERKLAVVHQFRLRRDGDEVIVGSATREPVDADSVWAALDDSRDDLPGTGS